jgi:DNA-binding transcriptional regulator GbsR (MarR family)
MNSNDNWAIFRRFGHLSTRALVQLQIELTDLEKEMKTLDDEDAADPRMKKRLRGYEGFEGWNNSHLELLSRVRQKLCEYCKLCHYS